MKTLGSVKRFLGSFSAEGSVTTPREWVRTRLPWMILGTGMYQNQPSSNARLPTGDRFFSRKMFHSPGSVCAGRPPTMWFQMAMFRYLDRNWRSPVMVVLLVRPELLTKIRHLASPWI